MPAAGRVQTRCEQWLQEAIFTTEALLLREKTTDLAHDLTLLAGRMEELLRKRDHLAAEHLRILAHQKAFWMDVHAVLESLYQKLQLAGTIGQPVAGMAPRIKRHLTESARKLPTGRQLEKLLVALEPLSELEEYADWVFLLAELHLEIEVQERALLELQLNEGQLQADAAIACEGAGAVFERTHCALRTRFFGEPRFVESFFVSGNLPRIQAKREI